MGEILIIMKKFFLFFSLYFLTLVLAGCASTAKEQVNGNQWKDDVLKEFYSMVDESNFTDEVDSVQLSDGKWRMIYYNVYNNYTDEEWQFLNRISGNVWDFTLKDGEPGFTEGWDYDKYTIEGDVSKLLEKYSWFKGELDGNEYFSLNQNQYKENDAVKKCSELLKNRVLPGFSKQLPEDSVIVIKSNEARTKFIYDYGTNWRPYFFGTAEDSPINTVSVYFIKME